MSGDLFDLCDAVVAAIEGWHEIDTRDPGGDTWFGIARAYHPAIPWPPTADQAREIRRAEYWLHAGCDRMPFPWCLAVYDCYLNQGGSAIRWAQAALGLKVDGQLGPATLATMSAAGSGDRFRAYLSLRISHYELDREYPSDGDGWRRRVLRIAQAGEEPLVAQRPSGPEVG